MPVTYLLDTNICIYIAKHRPPEVRARFARHAARELAMSVVTYGELRFGVEQSLSRDKAMHALEALTRTIAVVPLPLTAGEHYGNIRAILQRSGRPIGNNDLWLAAHAMAESRVMVTNNEGEFCRVPGLVVENWVGA